MLQPNRDWKATAEQSVMGYEEMGRTLAVQIEYERLGQFKALYDALDGLDHDFQMVTKNQADFEEGPRPMEYAMANLLFSAHKAGSYPTETPYTRVDALTTVGVLSEIPGGKPTLMTLLTDIFPQAVICTEHLFFLQREIQRAFDLPDDQRPARLRGQKLEDWTFPQDKIEACRVLALDLWRGGNTKHVDENRK